LPLLLQCLAFTLALCSGPPAALLYWQQLWLSPFLHTWSRSLTTVAAAAMHSRQHMPAVKQAMLIAICRSRCCMLLTMQMTWKQLLTLPGKLLQRQQKVQSYSLQQIKAVLLQHVSHQLLLGMQHSRAMLWCCHQMFWVLRVQGIKLVQLG
jgi:hypothetical protein